LKLQLGGPGGAERRGSARRYLLSKKPPHKNRQLNYYCPRCTCIALNKHDCYNSIFWHAIQTVPRPRDSFQHDYFAGS
jgi:hypothetical protein